MSRGKVTANLSTLLHSVSINCTAIYWILASEKYNRWIKVILIFRKCIELGELLRWVKTCLPERSPVIAVAPK